MNKILMGNPKYFEVSYEINPWMAKQIGQVDNAKAVEQWNKLYSELAGVTDVAVIDAAQGLPDIVFTANAGIVKGNTVVLSKFAKDERRGEEPLFRQWFEQNGYTVVQPKNNYEGEGDHLVDSLGRHWLGTGFRTERPATAELEKYLGVDINVLELTDPRWYHLDTCFCPLPGGEVMWYPGAFSTRSQQQIRNAFNHCIDVSESDALLFCCNCVCIGQDLFLPKDTAVYFTLKNIGYRLHEFDLSEYLKSGGSAKCLVLKLIA